MHANGTVVVWPVGVFTALCLLISISFNLTIHFLNTTALPISYDRALATGRFCFPALGQIYISRLFGCEFAGAKAGCV